MRALSFSLAIAFVLGVPARDVSVARDAIPGAGAFAYIGSPIAPDVATAPASAR
ncbi:hypothetical protein JQ557_20860 [Bradyrhizobium sp. U87765 SZCCT0131]|uniref:hypothetical protein n=1 Tax=unclassified Bradyrhizobium TaxID=2631580 RepID=UPI001BADF1D6|nr:MULTISPECIES: hypothetical protein [unclassified Bradyrhizobium]MBR1220465.1 hypothetical protein [Bradyrhizobium sp. U87765 SZCCT0131]MBR1263080.1 hypothetical protein [Bradyrhizobium sp. U87765 SZCCT0134]MBR1307037.1 hypothetical protein [Bradyrhizobium sp. U87765 SZCCT0110]MBR1323075.1 hypothetical protein [Bradyrhizobium sp. U87765 SZCCT0109]MBR1345991.1 hypothetical protein [Bradyrhizobium sp. U87765 SZCCT0048]